MQIFPLLNHARHEQNELEVWAKIRQKRYQHPKQHKAGRDFSSGLVRVSTLNLF
jgi:hypothetical protein